MTREQPQIIVGYRPKSEYSNKRCELCFYYQPLADCDDEGRCFGGTVRAEALCELFVERSAVEVRMAGT